MKITRDLLLHLVASYALVLTFATIGLPLWLCAVLTMAVGVAWEWVRLVEYDIAVEWQDLAADFAGIFWASVLLTVV